MKPYAATPLKALVIEDETDVRELIVLHLKREGISPDEAKDGEEGLRKARESSYQLFVLDWMLPGLSGLELIRTLRQELRLSQPILMVTARTRGEDIVQGLEAGADDYLTKPFEVPIFLARARALLRRSLPVAPSASTPKNLIELGGIKVDLDAHEAWCHGSKIALTLSEFNLLVALLQNSGRVLTRDKLIDLVRGEDVTIVNRAIDTHIFGLRKKLGACSELIETIRGIGYRVKTQETH